MYKKIQLWLRQYFDFNQREVNGFFVLMIILVLFLILPFAVQKFYPNTTENQVDNNKLDSLVAIIEANTKKDSTYRKYDYASSKLEKTAVLFEFNPNEADKEILIKLGFKPFLAERLLKYRSKVKAFEIKSDLKKVYGIEDEFYSKLESYILLPEKLAEKSITKNENFKKTENPILATSKLDINLADSIQFEKIYGIGSKLASRIIKYRNKLGGFVSTNQLEEVYGLDSAVIQEITKKMEIKSDNKPIKISINQADYNLLKSHPYIGYKFAKVILSYRQTHGGVRNLDDLKNIKIISTEEAEKMDMYLNYE